MTTALVWFRQDLRLTDNPALFEACTRHKNIIPLYILDGKNSVLGQAQAWWLHHSLNSLKNSLNDKLGLKLVLRKGNPLEVILELVNTCSINAIYWNRCYEPLVIERDKRIKSSMQELGLEVLSFNGSLLHEPWTIKNKSGDYFKVFTPYWNACRQPLFPQPANEIINRPTGIDTVSDKLNEWGLLPSLGWASQFPVFWTPGEEGAQQKLCHFIAHHLNGYKTNRNFPIKQATSRLSPHLHFGEINPWSILRAVELAKLDPNCDLVSAEHFLSELGWREFSYYLLYHVPTLSYENFKKEFDAFPWHNDEQLLTCWQKGMTGYPIIDAGMRELWATGYMHNRVRMIAASFLTKGLFIDWRLGADWFLDTLVDADLANNSASWQWVAGCGADAAPYFRIFNPVLQSQKFDPDGSYIRRWVPELSSLKNEVIHAPWEAVNSAEIYGQTKYPRPIVNHNEARAIAMAYYNQLKKKRSV
ncbi:cryptochrome/photolyase family protein [Legionella micdadei]|uniref:Deoxyribodipyrimidine photo-lyase n=1 Tax=Legionella micdadei TaxID=451 RepID=A0A098GGD6_LEGMI|nr:deoxyribodipyrimidine photo-lyase [Legionella micdadei]ARG97036.1 deoxyribodipyrimidine photo-lyase [Legionella micdadei]KTD26753.1 deoxyribodipyrimidine photolyase phrB [Legionella micdadei]NSL18257.1 deoxyribodipyrimidine photo-lyase [Legionella micdadei]CEG61549.1 putative deoxyribodipyrimidine photolyase phrB [Legionella micdadei]SCY45704.1 deoxyribodipyrimidine photo-lyase [Legionella micdadei]